MTPEPRRRQDHGERQIEAARRVIVDLGQVLGSFFEDSIVLVGGWVPDLLLPEAQEPHIGSINVDLALDTEKLRDGRYAEIVELLLASGRYERTDREFRMQASVDLDDGGPSLIVGVDFMKSRGRARKRRGSPLVEGFRPIDAVGCAAAFLHPESVSIEGHAISGTENRVLVRVVALEGFLLMKAYALARRDKPKDAYDLCYTLDHAPGGIEELARAWNTRSDDPLVRGAVKHLREKFTSVNSFGSQQVVAFHNAPGREERERQARRAFELVSRFLSLLTTIEGR